MGRGVPSEMPCRDEVEVLQVNISGQGTSSHHFHTFTDKHSRGLVTFSHGPSG